MTDLYVVFSVADVLCALPAASVRQLETYQGVTRVPGTAAHVAGVVQIRGQVLPVIDLRRLFGYPSTEATLDTRIVVTELGERHVGLIVDKAREVSRISTESVQRTPELMNETSRGFFAGLVQLGQRVVMLIDLRKVVGEEDLDVEFSKQLEPASQQPASLPAGHAGDASGTGQER